MHYNSIFISDLHLGTKHAKSKKMLDFLESNTCNNLFLVGDIIDGWALKRRHYWTDKQTEVIRRLLKISLKSNVYYLPGNHDDFLRPFFKYGFIFGSCKLLDDYLYYAIDGRRIFIVHGDRFDVWMKFPKKLINLLAHITDFIPVSWVSRAKQENQSPYRYLRVTGTESALKKYIQHKHYDAVICGHTHLPKLTDRYMNTGDWVEHCTALVEHLDGKWELVKYEKQDIDHNGQLTGSN